MCSPGSLKVINYESFRVLQELIADIPNVSFFPYSCESDLCLVGLAGSNLQILPAFGPEKAQVKCENMHSFVQQLLALNMFLFPLGYFFRGYKYFLYLFFI